LIGGGLFHTTFFLLFVGCIYNLLVGGFILHNKPKLLSSSFFFSLFCCGDILSLFLVLFLTDKLQ